MPIREPNDRSTFPMLSNWILPAALCIGVSATHTLGQTTYEWARPADGSFRDAANWLPMAVPGPEDVAILGGVGPYVVGIDAPAPGSALLFPRVSVLDISNEMAVARLGPGQRLALNELRGNGELHVLSQSNEVEPALIVTANGSIGGTVRLFSTFTAKIVNEEDASPATITESGLITGHGEIWGYFLNSGTIEASGPDPRISLVRGTINQFGGGVIRGVAGAGISLSSSRIQGGHLLLPEGGSVGFGSGGVAEGLTMVAGEGFVCPAAGASGTLIDVIMEGSWAIPRGNSLLVQRSLSGPGELIVNRSADSATSTLQLDGGATLDMRVRLNAPIGSMVSTRARVVHARSGTAEIGREGVVTGHGGVFGRIHNLGVIEAIGPDGLIEFAFNGTITQGQSGVIRCRGGEIRVLEANLSGGTWEAGRGEQAGLIWSVDDDNTIRDASFEGTWNVWRRITMGGELLGVPGGQGELVVNPDGDAGVTFIRFQPGALVDVPIRLNAGGSDLRSAHLLHPGSGDAVRLGPASTISGRGQLRGGTYTVEGELSPGVDGGSTTVSMFELLDAALAFAPTGRLIVDVIGPAASGHDRLAGTGQIVLDGVLDVRFADGYEPAATDRYEVVTATEVVGAFEEIMIEPSGAIIEVGPAHVVVTGTSAVLVVCAADRDGDGELTVFDFLAFQDQYASGDLAADLDRDGSLTIFDFLLFQNRFAQGCG